jgi:isocitrate lyase
VIESSNILNFENEWRSNPRWAGVTRPYSASDVEKLRGSIQIEHTLARLGAERLWKLFHEELQIFALGTLTGNQAIQQVRAGLQAVYVSGWQAAADANSTGQMYPDQSLYPVDTVPNLVRQINQSLIRADQINRAEGNQETHWLAPIVADAEGGFGGNLNAFELMKAMIEAGAACVHFEDQLSTIKKVGRLGGNVLVPTSEAIQKLIAARLAADVLGVPTLIMARTDALTCFLLTSDIDPRDREFVPGKRTSEGYFRVRGGVKMAIARALAYAPFADVIWTETVKPDLAEAKEFAEGILAKYPKKILAYNYAPSFHWRKNFDEDGMARLHTELAAMGYKFQFVTIAGFHALNSSMFDLADGFKQRGVAAYSSLQDAEFRNEEQNGYQGVNHQRFVGQGYFDAVQQIVTAGGAAAAASAMAGAESSSEAGQSSQGKAAPQE